MPLVNENHVEQSLCPWCAKPRPLDWFVGDSDACWKCREFRPELKHNLLHIDTGEAKRRKLKTSRGKKI